MSRFLVNNFCKYCSTYNGIRLNVILSLSSLPPLSLSLCLPPLSLSVEFVCDAVADVAFIVDSSGSIGRRNWRKMLDFLNEMVKAFNVGADKTHIAVVAYSNNAIAEIKFNTLTGSSVTEEEYKRLINRIRFQRGFTFIDKALLLADREVFTTAAGMRPELPQVLS